MHDLREIIFEYYTHTGWEAERNIENEIFNKLNYSKDYMSVWQLRFSQSRVNCQYFEMNFSYSTPNTHTLSRVIVSPGSGGTWELSLLETLTCFLCDHTNLCVPRPACETAVYAWTQTYVFQMVSVTCDLMFWSVWIHTNISIYQIAFDIGILFAVGQCHVYKGHQIPSNVLNGKIQSEPIGLHYFSQH